MLMLLLPLDCRTFPPSLSAGSSVSPPLPATPSVAPSTSVPQSINEYPSSLQQQQPQQRAPHRNRAYLKFERVYATLKNSVSDPVMLGHRGFESTLQLESTPASYSDSVCSC